MYIVLAELRYLTKLSQQAVADRMGNQQSTISDMESAFPLNCRVSTLQRYIDAVGGIMTINVKIDGREFILKQ